MKNIRTSFLNKKRDAWVEINLADIEHNVLEFKKYINKDAKVLAVVKADAYGCGAVMLAPTLLASGIDVFGVASIDEGEQLRQAGINVPILVLGAVPLWAFDYASENDITISIFSQEHINAAKIAYEKTGIKQKVHIKIDSGMNRIGVRIKDAVEYIKQVQNSDFIDLRGIFTHFACAEDKKETEKQLERFNSVISQIDTTGIKIHFANTNTIMAYQGLKYDMARLGIGLYGYLPDLSLKNMNLDLKQAVSLKGRITNIHTAQADEGVSYSHTFKTKKMTKIATIPIGYADGVSRLLSNKIQASLNGKFINQIGNITMDQMMFDITDLDAQEGDIITLIGQDKDNCLSIDDWANKLNTINYELLCRLKVRLSRVYTR